jgi:hypothetical protein
MYRFILLATIFAGCAANEGFTKQVKSETYYEAKGYEVKQTLIAEGQVSPEMPGPPQEAVNYEVQVYKDGSRYWYTYGRLNRVEGPAVEYADGGKLWYKDGLLHRSDGPAVELRNGKKQWWLDGIEYKKKAFEKKLQK